jgi:APA family basic amino acid/polyamine antiporter
MTKLKKELNLYGLTMIAIGSCIGAGIFTAPGQVVEAVPNHLLVLLVWLFGGIIALTGALTFSELGSMFPKAGGVYVYLREAYGDLAGFLYGWVTLLVINTGAIAALAILFAEYITTFPLIENVPKTSLAIIAIVLLTSINIFGVSIGQLLANVFTGFKLLAIAGIILVGIFYFDSSRVDLDFSLATAPDNLIQAMFVGLIGVFFSIGGWHHASYLSGEAINATKTVPRAMILGVTVVTITYIFINLVYMMLLPLPQIAETETIAGDALGVVFPFGKQIMALVISLSVFGSIGIFTMSAPRIYLAMANDGIFFKQLTLVHPTYKTPVVAMAIQAVWAILLIIVLKSFRELMAFVIFMDIIFMTLAGLSIFVFRIKRKNSERPVKVILYPFVPIIYILFSAAFVVSTLLAMPSTSWYGLIILAVGIPLFYYFKNKNLNEGRSTS